MLRLLLRGDVFLVLPLRICLSIVAPQRCTGINFKMSGGDARLRAVYLLFILRILNGKFRAEVVLLENYQFRQPPDVNRFLDHLFGLLLAFRVLPSNG